VKHIDLNAQGKAAKQFFLSLPVDPEGSVVELNGQPVARQRVGLRSLRPDQMQH
jgi:hypothetical protein